MARATARRVEIPNSARTMEAIETFDYAGAFALALPVGDRRTALQWSRAVFEGAASPVRGFLLMGWRVVLGLRLAPLGSNQQVLGWRIRSAQNHLIVLEQDSPLITAHNIVQLDGTQVTWTTFVKYRNVFGRLAWSLVVPFHAAVIPRLLRSAAGRSSEH